MRWIVNASPVILLAKIGQADLLLRIPSETVIPHSVFEEVCSAGGADPGHRWITSLPQGIVRDDTAIPSEIASWDLGKGETAVIAWAVDAGQSEVVIDDLAGRRCAEVMRVPVTGSLGVLLIAKKKHLIPAAAPFIRDLRDAGAHLSDSLVQSALQLVGE